MHAAAGRANTLRGFQATRPIWYEQEAALRALPMAVLVLVGDEDDACIEPAFPASGRSYRSHLEALPPALLPVAVVGGDLAVAAAFLLFAAGPAAALTAAVAARARLQAAAAQK